MNTTSNETPTTSYQIETTPWYFGAYLNMGRHNLFLLINHLSHTFSHLGFKPLKDDEDLGNDKKFSENILVQIFDPENRKYQSDRFKVYKYLVKRHYLPFIKLFHREKGYNLDANPVVDYKGLHQFIISVLLHFNHLRNTFSHYLSLDEHYNQLTTREVKVDDTLKKGLQKLFSEAQNYALERYSLTQEEKDYRHIEKYYPFEVGSNTLTNNGLLFFTCLFLEPSFAYKFLARVKGFKNTSIPAFKATLQVFTAYAPTLADNKLDSEYSQTSLLMDMLNELQRCPQELYKHLSDDDKKKFEPTIDADAEINMLIHNINDEQLSNDNVNKILSSLISLRRHSDRFPHFALRFLEEFNLLPSISFQIAVGKLHTKAYPKIIAGEEVDRRIVNNIHLFGKLTDFEGKESEILEGIKQQIDEKETEEIYFDQYAPHYNIQGNNIAFIITKDKTINYGNKQPTGFISLHDLPKLLLLALCRANNQDNNKGDKEIISFKNLNDNVILNKDKLTKIKETIELTPQEFSKRQNKEKLLQSRDGKTAYLTKDIENSILNRYKLGKELLTIDKNALKERISNKTDLEYTLQIQYKAFLKQRKDNLQNYFKNIPVSQLPTRLVNELLNIREVRQENWINQKIKDIKADCEKQIRWIKQVKDKEHIKIGELATYLARDIVDMIIDKDVKQKITSVYYNKLQNLISYFSISKGEIIKLGKELAIFDKDKGHVFLQSKHINEKTSVQDFYLLYLEEKQKWIEKTLSVDDNKKKYHLPKNQKIPYSYQKLDNSQPKSIDSWLENKKKMPINLPNNLLDKALEAELNAKRTNNVNFAEKDKYTMRLAKLMENDSQPFYQFKRIYKAANNKVENDRDKTIVIDTTKYTGKKLKKETGKYGDDNEKLIRFTQTKDRIIKLMCQYILEKQAAGSVAFKLADIMPFAEKSILNKPYEFTQQLIVNKNNKDYKVLAKDTEQQKAEVKAYEQLTNDKDRKDYKGQQGYEWTIKDYGRFKRFVADKRIPDLLHYFEEKTITFSMINYQLQEYDKYRELIFKKTFELEEKIFWIDPEGIKQEERKARENKNFNSVQFNIYQKWMKNLYRCRCNRLKAKHPDLLAIPNITHICPEYIKKKQAEIDIATQQRRKRTHFQYFTNSHIAKIICFCPEYIKMKKNQVKIDVIAHIRNKFSHSQFPADLSIPKITKAQQEAFEEQKLIKDGIKQLDLSIAEKIYHHYVALIEQVIPE